MRAVVLEGDAPRLAQIADPSPRPDQVLARIRASALNRIDVLRRGVLTHGGGFILGQEWAGDVVDVGPDARTDLRPGDRVMGGGPGAFAELIAVDPALLFRTPDRLSAEEASTLPTALVTMHDALVTHGRLEPGQSVLIQGASSGIGLMGLQIAKLMGADKVIGTSRDPRRRGRLGDYGADLTVDPGATDWVEQILAATGGNGVDLVIDQISGPLAAGAMRATRVLGRYINVGRLGGTRAEFDFDRHALQRITYVGVTFRNRSRAEVLEIASRMTADLWPAVEAGRIAMPVDRVFDFSDALAALDHMRSDAHFGRIVLRH